MGPATGLAGQVQCQSLFTTIESQRNQSKKSKTYDVENDRLLQLIKFIENHRLNPTVFSFQSEPQWSTYNSAVQLLKLVQESQVDFKHLDQAKIKEVNQYLKSTGNVYELQGLTSKKRIDLFDKRFDFYYILSLINHATGLKIFILPEERLIQKLGLRTNEQLALEAQKIVQKSHQVFDQEFAKSKYKSFSDFMKEMINLRPEFKAKIPFIRENTVVGIHLNEGSRFWVSHVGFRNQRVVGRSNGGYDPQRMDVTESQLASIPLKDYKNQSPRSKPVYGELILRPELMMSEYTHTQLEGNNNFYGHDIWVLKNSSIEHVTTLTLTDSWSVPSSYTKSHFTVKKFNPWSKLGIPYQYKEMLAFNYYEALENKKYEVAIPDEVVELFHIDNSVMTEAQIWAPKGIDDVESFIFYQEEPTQEFYQFLKSKNIKVYDGRKVFDGSGSGLIEYLGEKDE